MEESEISGWMSRYGWERNPFNFQIYPDLMIGYEDEAQRVRNSIESGGKFTLLLGRTGAGKTNMLQRISTEYDDRPLFYMSKPPVTEEALLTFMRDEVLEPGFLARLRNTYSLYNLDEAVNRKYDEQIILLVDEGHEASVEVLEWLRTAIDHISSMTVVAAGLPEFETKLQDDVNTLYSRATEVVNLESLDKDHSIELVRKRIEQVGGSSIEPFTQSALLEIYDATEGFPREILRVCNDCVITAATADKSIIDEDDVRAVLDESSYGTNSDGEGGVNEDEGPDGPAEPDDAEQEPSDEDEDDTMDLRMLTDKQRSIYDAVADLEEATSGEIVDHIGLDDYKSRSHAIRSINNILRRLMEQDVVERERKGRTYLYRPVER